MTNEMETFFFQDGLTHGVADVTTSEVLLEKKDLFEEDEEELKKRERETKLKILVENAQTYKSLKHPNKKV